MICATSHGDLWVAKQDFTVILSYFHQHHHHQASRNLQRSSDFLKFNYNQKGIFRLEVERFDHSSQQMNSNVQILSIYSFSFGPENVR